MAADSRREIESIIEDTIPPCTKGVFSDGFVQNLNKIAGRFDAEPGAARQKEGTEIIFFHSKAICLFPGGVDSDFGWPSRFYAAKLAGCWSEKH